jgi:hypothetical protein
MADILFPATAVQSTAAPTIFYDLLLTTSEIQETSSACLVDLVPPTFAGVVSLDIESRGQIRVEWAAGTDITLPIRYEVYIQAATATGLFNTANIIAITPNLQFDVYSLPNGDLLSNGTVYYVGVRALDGVGNRDSNTVSQSVISTGILTSIDVYECKAAWSTNTANDLRVTAWANKNSSTAKAPSEVMGAASYQFYDADGIAVVGMSGTLLSPNALGLYVFSPIPVAPSLINNHYEVKVTISVDGEDRSNFIGTVEDAHVYSMEGVADISYDGTLTGSFWVRSATGIITTDLGTGSWDLFTVDGTDTGIGGTGLTANADGFFIVPPFTFPGPLDTTNTYVVRTTATVAGRSIDSFVTLAGDPLTFDPRAIFSISASNMLQATFWAVRNEEMAPLVTLGTASYQVYDAVGAAVVGLSESGLTADGNGYYHITPVSAALLTDLTHYKVKVTIEIQGQERSSTHGFTLLGN